MPHARQEHLALHWGARPAPSVEQVRLILCLEARCYPHASRVVWELTATLAKHRAAIASQAITAPIPPRSRRNVPQAPIVLLRAAPLICANQASCALKKGLLSKRRARRGTTVLRVTKVFPAQPAHSPHHPAKSLTLHAVPVLHPKYVLKAPLIPLQLKPPPPPGKSSCTSYPQSAPSSAF